MMPVLAYVGICLLIGLIGESRRGGFVLYFLLATIATPPVALLAMILMTPRPKHPKKPAA